MARQTEKTIQLLHGSHRWSNRKRTNDHQTQRRTHRFERLDYSFAAAYNGRFYDTALNEANDARTTEIVPRAWPVAKEPRCAEGPSVKTMLCGNCNANQVPNILRYSWNAADTVSSVTNERSGSESTDGWSAASRDLRMLSGIEKRPPRRAKPSSATVRP